MLNFEVGPTEYGVLKQASEQAPLTTRPQLSIPKDDEDFGAFVWEKPTDPDIAAFRVAVWRDALELVTFVIDNGEDSLSAEQLLAFGVVLVKLNNDPFFGDVSF